MFVTTVYTNVYAIVYTIVGRVRRLILGVVHWDMAKKRYRHLELDSIRSRLAAARDCLSKLHVRP